MATEVYQSEWRGRVQQICDVYWKRMVESRPDLSRSLECFKDFILLIIFRVGPNDYNNILVVWPALQSGPFYLEDLKECIFQAWRD